ncbi:MAG: glutaredoxin family protein [Methylomarinum sp.]|nr:glutaredoxin family protein [Methylomarinum sp.]
MKLILLGTSGCHLCEQAELIMAAFDQVEIELIDIAEQEQWQEKYAIRIPVLYHPETKSELGWPFDQQRVQVFIDKCSLLRKN